MNTSDKLLALAKDANKAASVLDTYMPHTPWVKFLRSYARQHGPQTVFEFAGRDCLVDGERIHCTSMGLPLAWMVLVAHQHRLGAIELGWIFPGRSAHRSLSNTINRAADDAERYSLRLAAAISSIGAEHGRIVVKNPQRGIVCVSPRLAQAVRGVTSA